MRLFVNSGLAISYTPGQPGILSGGQTNGKIHSDYRSVTKQAGIYAGTGGYDITTNGTTTLTGAVIASKADKETNRLTTGNLIMKDIQNEASYSASSDGFNLSTDKGTTVNPLGLGKVTSIPVNGEATSITRSAIAEGLILVADKRSEKEINHNTQEAMQTLGKIFDKKSVEEKQALVNQMAQEGYKLIGDVAVSKQKELLRKALVAAANNDKKSAEAYLQEAKKWEEGGTYKLILHGALGGVLSGMSSEGFSSGFVGATSNELLQKALGKIPDSELHKLASLVIGNTVSGKTGGAIAEIATDENWLNHYDQMALLTDIINYKQEWTPDKTTIMNKLAYYIALSNKTEPYAEQLGINDGIDNSFIGLNSLPVYLPIGKNTLAAGLYGFAEAEGIDRGRLDRAVSYHESYMTDAYLKGHYPLLNATAEEIYNAYSRNSDLSFNNMVHKGISTYSNKGDYYADQGHSVIASTDGNNYVYVGGQFLYTTRKAQYTKEEFGSALADHGWPVERVYWNGQPVNVVEYNGVAYYANREVTPVHSSDNIDNESARSWTHTALQSGVEFSAGVTHSIDDNVSFGGAQWAASAIKGDAVYKANTTPYMAGRVFGDVASTIWGIGNVATGTGETLAGIAGTPVTAGASLGISAVGIGQIGYGSAVTGMASSNLLDDMQTLFAKRNKGSQATEALTTETKPLTRAQEFEKSLVHLPASERVGIIRTKLREIAKGNGWKKLERKVGNREIFEDKKGNYYTIDTQHGRFEKFDKKGNHLGEYDIDGNFIRGSIDYSGNHNIFIK